MVDYAQEQQEELEAIESIYSEEIDIIGDGPHRSIISIYWSLVDMIKCDRPKQRNRVFYQKLLIFQSLYLCNPISWILDVSKTT